MARHEEIKNAYRFVGKEATFYDGMITCSTLVGRLICKLVWNMVREDNDAFLMQAVSGIPDNFNGKLLEVPVGTGVLTMPIYQTLPEADITCLDYSTDMMSKARKRAERDQIKNITFLQGDVGNLPFEDESFDLVLSLNGFHAFPDKEAAYREIYRVLKPDGIFCGCFYIQGEEKRTDWFIRHLYEPKGFFTPPYETKDSLKKRLNHMYTKAEANTVKGIASFCCRK
ncbi:MAG: class I SAM-dependent methyltransferase [Eubacteriales bacterium]|nr:class I SAM-dependent methyltransferase [Eubacteriales bacterium]